MALSSKQDDNHLVVVQSFELDRPKTRDFAVIQSTFGFRKALIVVPEKERNLELATRNIPGVKLVSPEQLNVYELLKYPQLVLTPAVVEHLKERLQ
jgi:large subunit ribosomal protein L4